ncbi:MAG: vitamin K epoxide reductase family protein [Gammaproteobacteria bacterium]
MTTTPLAPRTRDLPLAILAACGVVLTALLLWRAGSAAGLPYCNAGSGCDVVQSSAWSRFLGLPLAAWGMMSYVVLGGLALWVTDSARRARWSALAASAGFGISVYLTVVSATLIEALCAYCLLSLALFTLAFVWSIARRPAGAGMRMHAAGLLAAVAVATAMHADARGWFVRGEGDPYLRALAEHLAASGAAFYGASWCPHCQDQKAVFGAAAEALPYVECSPNGPRAPRATACEMADIRNYPTWIIGGRRIERVMPPETLAGLTGFDAAAAR